MSSISNTQEISKKSSVDICPLQTEQRKNVHKPKDFYFKDKIPLLGQLNIVATIHSQGQFYFGLLFCIPVKCEHFPLWCYKTLILPLPSGTSADTN